MWNFLCRGQDRSRSHPLRTYGNFVRRWQTASRKPGHDSDHPGVFLRRASLVAVMVRCWQTSKCAQTLFEHPYPLSLGILCLMNSSLMADGDLPRSSAI